MFSPRLGFAYLEEGETVPETSVNEIASFLEAGAGHFIVKDRDLTAPPGAPAQLDTYLVAAGATGAWTGQAGKLAIYIGTAWTFMAPIEGLTAWIADENNFLVYDGAAWTTPTVSLSNEAIDDRVAALLVAGANITLTYNDAAGTLTIAAAGAATPTESIIIACSDEATALTAGTAKVTFRMPYAFTLTAVKASLNTAPTGSTLIVDINEGGVSILSTKLSIDATEKTSATAASAAVISDAVLAADAEITIDIDQIGSTIAGAGLKVYLIGHQ